jgi:hypothetical protein
MRICFHVREKAAYGMIHLPMKKLAAATLAVTNMPQSMSTNTTLTGQSFNVARFERS